MGKRVKIAVVGAGLVGRQHIQRIVSEPEIELSIIIDPDSSAKDLANDLCVPWRDAIEGDILNAVCDGAIIATPNRLHVEHGLRFIERGVPILVEKPISDHVLDATSLVSAAERYNIDILVGHHRRHSAILQSAKKAITEGALGEIVTAHAMFWVYKPEEYYAQRWRIEDGGGPIAINAIHDVDCFRYLLGDIKSVQARLSRRIRGFGVEDSAVVLVDFVSGVLATLSISDSVVSPWSWEMTARENPVYPPQNENCYFLGGTLSSMSIPSLDVWKSTGERSWWVPLSHVPLPANQAEDPLLGQLRHFRDVINGEAKPIVSGRDGLETLRVVEAIHRSARSREIVYL